MVYYKIDGIFDYDLNGKSGHILLFNMDSKPKLASKQRLQALELKHNWKVKVKVLQRNQKLRKKIWKQRMKRKNHRNFPIKAMFSQILETNLYSKNNRNRLLL